MNILFISSWYPSRLHSTLGNFVERHVEAIAPFCNSAVVYAQPDPGVSREEIRIEEKSNYFVVYIFYPPPKFGVLPFIGGFFRMARKYGAYLKGWKVVEKRLGRIELIHANILFPVGIIARRLSEQFYVPFIVTEHSTAYGEKDGFSSLQLSMIRKAAKKAACIVPVSFDLRNAMQKVGVEANYDVIPNVVDTGLFKMQPEEDRGRITKFLHVSTLRDKQKNISGMLRAFQRLSKKRTDWKLTIVSDGVLQPHIRYAKELGILDRFVSFEGEKSINEISGIMANHDCFVLFSNFETFGCVIIEAFACGLPVIATKVADLPIMIDESNGMLVTPGDEDDLLACLGKMLEKLPDFDRRHIREKAIEMYSYEKVGERYADLYNKILKQIPDA